jgi:hypothetical protein
MAKNSITDYDNIAANNTDIQSVDIDEGCAPSGINNAIRELMADLADVNDGTVPLASPDINGGTIDGATIGGTTAGAGTFTAFTSNGIDDNATSNAVTIDSSGNVGIGTSSPACGLHIDNPDNGAITAILDTDNSAVKLIFRNTTETGNNIQIGADGSNFVALTGATERMRIDSSGNVGIGTSSPDAKMNIEQSGIGNFDSIILSRTTGNVGDVQSIVWRQNDLSNLKAASISGEVTGASAGALVFNTATGGTLTERMRIDSSGNLLVGKSVTTLSTNGIGLAASGEGRFTRDGDYPLLLNRKTSTGGLVLFYKDGIGVGSISTNGTTTAYNTISDYRLKEDMQPMTGAIGRVNALNPVNFAWKSDGSRVDGFLAHEAQAVVPEAVHGTKDAMRDEEYEVTPAVLDEDGNVVTEAVMGTRSVPDYQGIDQSKLVPLLTAALQEAITKIETLETKVAALESA